MDNPIKCKNMIQRVAGTVVLIGLALAWFVHPWFVAVTAFAGLNLLQSSFTGICPVEWLLSPCQADASGDIAAETPE